jgi:WhiB family transcriptional regulator, redox-sensing transcriptional regulator
MTKAHADWRALGACLSADPELFFPLSCTGPSIEQLHQAKTVCAGCQVRPQCLEFALATRQVHGVWGGTSEDERHQLLAGGTIQPQSAMASGVPAGAGRRAAVP